MRRNLYNANVMTGSQLREAREERGWTQARLAEELGMEPEKGGKLVSSWEHMEEIPRLRETDLRRLLFPEGDDDDLLSQRVTMTTCCLTPTPGLLRRSVLWSRS